MRNWTISTDSYRHGGKTMMKGYIAGRKSQMILEYGVFRRSEALIRHFRQLNCSTLDTILDVGTADGLVLCRLMRDYNINCCIGIDIRFYYLKAARENDLHVVQADGRYLPFISNSVDVIISTAVFKHIKGLDKLVGECCRVLKPDGKMIIIDPTPWGIRMGLLLKHFSHKSIFQILSLEDTKQMLIRHNFAPISEERFMLTPIPFIGCNILERVLKGGGLQSFIPESDYLRKQVDIGLDGQENSLTDEVGVVVL